MLNEILSIIILVCINAFFAGAEIAVISLKRINVEKKANEGDKKAKQLLEIINEPSRFLATIQVGLTLAVFFTSASAAVGISKTFEIYLKSTGINLFVKFGDKISFILITILISFISLLFGELIPKRIALRKAEKIAEKSVGIIKFTEVITKPLVIALTSLTNFFVYMFIKDSGKLQDNITEEEVKLMINVGEEKGIFRKMETEMINSIFQFDDINVGDIMIPRPDIVAIDIKSNFEETVKIISREKYSRIPVYEDNIDNIVGILYAKDIIDYMIMKNHKDFNLVSFIRKPFFVTEYKKIDILLKEMQKNSVHISIAIDEYGSTAGLITIEDLLEVIVGKIYDEYDDKEEEISKKGKDKFEIDGGINILELNEALDSNYVDNYDTVSGLILDYIGRFPEEGESIFIEDHEFTVLEIENMRIKRLLVKKKNS